MFKLVLEKAEERRDQIVNIHWIMDKAREFKKNMYLLFINYANIFDCVNHNKLWKILKEMGIPDHLTCLLRNLYAGREATVKTRHGTTDWFQIRKGVQAVYCHPAYLTYMQDKKKQLELDMEQQTGSKLGKEYIKAFTVRKL